MLTGKVHIAALLAVSSALCIAIGDVLQQRAAHGQAFAKLLRDPRWWLGLVLLGTSLGLQVIALGVGSVLLVQALLMLSVLFALPINARLSDRVVTAPEWMWAGVLTAAVVVIVTVGHPAAGDASASLRSWAVVAVVLGPLLAACIAVAALLSGASAAVLFALASGSLWGIFAVVSKDVLYRLGERGWGGCRNTGALPVAVDRGRRGALRPTGVPGRPVDRVDAHPAGGPAGGGRGAGSGRLGRDAADRPGRPDRAGRRGTGADAGDRRAGAGGSRRRPSGP